jgi:hypothetical protein
MRNRGSQIGHSAGAVTARASASTESIRRVLFTDTSSRDNVPGGACPGDSLRHWESTSRGTFDALPAGRSRKTAISTRRVAMCARHILEELVTALLIGVRLLMALRRGIAYLIANARRADVRRDRRAGRLRTGLVTVGVA